MHPLHDYIAAQLANNLRRRRIVVWYDPRREFAAFVSELRAGGSALPLGVETVQVAGSGVSLGEFAGSYFELRQAIEPLVSGDDPAPLLLYMPGVEHDRKGSVLTEVEKAGECWEPQLKRLARNVLRQRLSDGVIDELLAPEAMTYADLASLCSQEGTQGPSVLKTVFPSASGNEGLVAAVLGDSAHDDELEAKGGTLEFLKLAESRLGLSLVAGMTLSRIRANVARYVLANEFRDDLRCDSPAKLDAIANPLAQAQHEFVRTVAIKFRQSYPERYEATADAVEAELALTAVEIRPEALGAIDTFRFEEVALLRHCDELLSSADYNHVLEIVGQRGESFWVQRYVGRKARWEAARLMAELGLLLVETQAAVEKAGNNATTWLAAYSAPDGWYRLDGAHRRLEAWVTRLDDDPESERPLGLLRRAYENLCHEMARRFTTTLEAAGWNVGGILPQTRVFPEAVESSQPTAWILVDALRFEMGMELAERVGQVEEISVRPAVAALPTLTPVGMAALLPGASSSLDVVAQNAQIGARIDGTFLPDVAARRKFLAAKVPGVLDLLLDDVLTWSASKLAKRIAGVSLVVVRSQEIDFSGEQGFTHLARQVIDTSIDNVARGVRKLAGAGIERIVVTADHGHLFSLEKDESMRIAPPLGETIELHRRCWIGRGGSTPPGCVRVTGRSLGYDSDLDFVIPAGLGVFKSGGDLAFHHGAASLQEVVIPVITIRMKTPTAGRVKQGVLGITGLPNSVTNRIFTVGVATAEGPSLLGGTLTVRPILQAGGRQVGVAGMAVGAALDRATGCIALTPGQPATVALLLTSEEVAAVRVVIQDPATDAVLYQSEDIPVRLGI